MRHFLSTKLASLLAVVSLIGWGVAYDRSLISVLMLVVFLILDFSSFKIHLPSRSTARINDLTLAILAFSALWFWLSRSSLPEPFAVHLLSWCPLFFYPKLLFSSVVQLDRTTPARAADGSAVARIWLLRSYPFSRRALDAPADRPFVDVYVFLCGFVALVALPWRVGLFFALCIPLALTSFRGSQHPFWKERSHLIALLSIAAVALLISFFGSLAIESGQRAADRFFGQLWPRSNSGSSNLFSNTAIGRSGRIDNGERLLYRVEWSELSGYLRDGSFSYTSTGSRWSAIHFDSSAPEWHDPLRPNQDQTFILPSHRSNRSDSSPLLAQARISTTLSRDRQALPLPIGAAQVYGLPVPRLDVNPLGAISLAGASGFVKFGVAYEPVDHGQPAPLASDFQVPSFLIPALDAFLDQSGARGLPVAQAASRIQDFFRSRWTYTLQLSNSAGQPRTLSSFLTGDRQGHCEYFASATTLALRRLGFPARYETGFRVQEFDSREKLFWVRSRDAHAWSSYWDGSAWRQIDSTPGGGLSSEEVAWDQRVSDWFSRLQFWLDESDPTKMNLHIGFGPLAGLGILLALYLFWRLRHARFSRAASSSSSAFPLLIDRLSRLTGEPIHARETSSDYLLRVAPLMEGSDRLSRLAHDRDLALFSSDSSDLARTESQARRLLKRLRKRKSAI